MRNTSIRRKNTKIAQKAAGETKIVGDEYEIVPVTGTKYKLEQVSFDAYQADLYKLVSLSEAIDNVNKYLGRNLTYAQVYCSLRYRGVSLPEPKGFVNKQVEGGHTHRAYFENEIYPVLIPFMRKFKPRPRKKNDPPE